MVTTHFNLSHVLLLLYLLNGPGANYAARVVKTLLARSGARVPAVVKKIVYDVIRERVPRFNCLR